MRGTGEILFFVCFVRSLVVSNPTTTAWQIVELTLVKNSVLTDYYSRRTSRKHLYNNIPFMLLNRKALFKLSPLD